MGISATGSLVLQSARQNPIAGIKSIMPRLPKFERIWTVAEAAKATGYHPEYLRELCRQQTINAERVGSTWLIDADSLEKHIEDNVSDARFGPKK